MKDIIIGDVHGCYDALKDLLNQCQYHPDDKLWFVGDLINRGDKNLDVLRFVQDLGDKASVVPGNHDIHFIAVYFGVRSPGSKDTFDDVLNAADADEHVKWMLSLPFAIHDKSMNMLMVHAGLYPGWDLKTTLKQAGDLSRYIQGADDKARLFTDLFGNKPHHWKASQNELKRCRAVLNILTRIRFIYFNIKKEKWQLDFKYKGDMKNAGHNLEPWFRQTSRAIGKVNVVFGHWSALGYYHKKNILCLDGGYLWGGSLHALVVENKAFSDGKLVSVNLR